MIKDRYSNDLTEAEGIKKRLQEYTDLADRVPEELWTEVHNIV